MTSAAVDSLRHSFSQELQQIEPAKLMRYRAAGLFDKKFTVARPVVERLSESSPGTG